MRYLCVIALVAAATLSLAALAEQPTKEGQLLVNARPEAGTIQERVSKRRCFAGRIKIIATDKEKGTFSAETLEQYPSSRNHPNSRQLQKIRLVALKNDRVDLKAGGTYCMIITHGSKSRMTVVAYGRDDPETVTETKKVIESAEAHENDAEWQKRRKLWHQFKRQRRSKEKILVYCENDSCDALLYYIEGSGLHVFKIETGKEKSVVSQKRIATPNRITFEKGMFRIWCEGEVELNVGV